MPAVDRKSLPISVRGLTKSYGPTRAVEDVSLEVASGEFLTLLGPSGSGKTTLLMVLAGFIRPNRGNITFGDRDVTLLPPHRRNVGMVFQNYALFPHMTVLQNVMYPLRLRGMRRIDARRQALDALSLVRLGDLGARRVGQLSGGQQQRVALARAIVFEPPILLMDEPLSALDKKLREQMQLEIRRLHERLGATTVYVTHDQREALTISDRIAVINGGQLLQVDTPERIYNRPSSLFVADFIGESSFLPVVCDSRGALLNGRLLCMTRDRNLPGKCLLMVRPEWLELLAGAPPDGMNVLEGTVTGVVYQGDSVVLDVILERECRVAVRTLSRRGNIGIPSAGSRIRLGLHPEDTVLVPEADA
jgi:putative spermidine/putrescine transport system ATP-binding protein